MQTLSEQPPTTPPNIAIRSCALSCASNTASSSPAHVACSVSCCSEPITKGSQSAEKHTVTCCPSSGSLSGGVTGTWKLPTLGANGLPLPSTIVLPSYGVLMDLFRS